MTREMIEEIFKLIEEDVNRKDEDSGFGGVSVGYAAPQLRQQLAYYKAGMEMKLPPNWKGYYKKVKRSKGGVSSKD